VLQALASISTDDATFTLTSATGSTNLVVGDQVRDASGLTATYSATTGISGLALDGTPAAVVDTQGTTVTTDDATEARHVRYTVCNSCCN
jgi:hypothetical protein